MIHSRLKSCACAVGLLWCLACAPAHGDAIGLPVNDSHVIDMAQLVAPEDIAAIDAICNDLQTQREIPIFIVTIESIASHGPADTTIESFAWDLFEQWGVDPAFTAAPHWRHGILFLISKNDRSARIELGLDWGPEHTQGATDIMNRIIVPSFKSGEFSAGILKGVSALESLDRLEPDSAPVTPGTSPMLKFLGMSALMLVGFGLLYGTLVLLASKIKVGGPYIPGHATSDNFGQTASVRAPGDASIDPLYEHDPMRPLGIYPNPSDTSTLGDSAGFDSGGGASDSGGGFSDGGGATGSW